MSKKYYINDKGEKIFLDDKDLKDAEPATDDPKVPPVPPVPPSDDEEEKDLEAAAEKAAKTIVASLGLDQINDLKKNVDALMKSSVPMDSKLVKILNGKDYVKDVDKLTKEEKIIGFFHALVTNNQHALKALSETAADGGNLLPQDFMAELNRDLVDLVVMRRVARVIPMRRNTMVIPRATAAVKVYWTAENATKTTTTAQFTQDSLTAFKLAAILYASDELIEDSTSMGAFDIVRLIITMFAESIAEVEEDAFGQGNGTTAPLGIETARAAGTFASIAAGGQNFDDIIRLVHTLKAQYRKNAAFICHDLAIRNMRMLKDGNNRYLWQEPITQGQPATFFGYPVYAMDTIPQSVIYFGDWKRGYWIGDRQQMTVKITQDSETAFTKDQTAIRVVERVGAQVVLPAALKAMTGF